MSRKCHCTSHCPCTSSCSVVILSSSFQGSKSASGTPAKRRTHADNIPDSEKPFSCERKPQKLSTHRVSTHRSLSLSTISHYHYFYTIIMGVVERYSAVALSHIPEQSASSFMCELHFFPPRIIIEFLY